MKKKSAGVFASIALATLALTLTFANDGALARDGITACHVEKAHVWRYFISLNVPAGTTCQVFYWQDTTPGEWERCWQESTNTSGKRCSDVINNKSFKDFKVKAECNGKVFTKRCRL